LALGAAAAGTAHAHHSIAAVYDSSKRLTVEGVVTEFQFVNPHPFLVIEGVAGEHEGQTWRLEMDNRIELSDIGIAADTFKAGDRVVASGSGSRTEAQRLYLYRLDRESDGLRYEQVGSRPRINVPAPR
jgi:hypothetical protein